LAQTALTADTASYVEIAQSASNAEKVTVTNVTTSMGGPWYPMFTSTSNGVNAIVSVDTNQYIYTPTTNTLTVTASQAISASYAPPSNPFPYTGSAEILGTLGVTGSTTITDLSDTAKTKISADYIAMYNPSATFDIWLSGSGNNETTVYSGGPADLTIHSDQKLRINATSTEITGSVNITGSINSTGSIALGKPDAFGNRNVNLFYNGIYENLYLGAGNGGTFKLNKLTLDGQSGISTLSAENIINILAKSTNITGSTNVTGSFAVSGSLSSGEGTVILPGLVPNSYADDTAAAAAGIPIGGLYRNGSVIQIRLV
jgi:hypothetical protein